MRISSSLSLALAALALLATAAAAEKIVPALKNEVTVNGDFVRLGDLIDNAGANAGAPLFRSPELGTSGTIQVYRIIEAARGQGLSVFDTRGLSEVVVLRASRTIALPELERMVADTAARQYGLADKKNLAVSFDAYVRVLAIEPEAVDSLRFSHFSFDQRTQRFEANIDIPASAALRRRPIRVSGSLYETAETATLNRPLARGETIRDADITVERRPKAEIADTVRADTVVGQAARRDLRPGQYLRASDLMKPELVGRGDLVTLVFEGPGVKVTMQAKALEAGTKGDVVQVLNQQSKRVIQATVDGPNRVVITRAQVARAPEAETTGSIK